MPCQMHGSQLQHEQASCSCVTSSQSLGVRWGVQVYNEGIYDLLRAETAPRGVRALLRIKEDAAGRVLVDGLQEVHIPPLLPLTRPAPPSWAPSRLM